MEFPNLKHGKISSLYRAVKLILVRISPLHFEYPLHQAPFLARGCMRVSDLVLRHVLLPLHLPRLFPEPAVVPLPVEVILRLDYHEQQVVLQIDLHIKYPDRAEPFPDFRPHMVMLLCIRPDQLRIILQSKSLAISFHDIFSTF